MKFSSDSQHYNAHAQYKGDLENYTIPTFCLLMLCCKLLYNNTMWFICSDYTIWKIAISILRPDRHQNFKSCQCGVEKGHMPQGLHLPNIHMHGPGQNPD
jgi:hypothetical protein